MAVAPGTGIFVTPESSRFFHFHLTQTIGPEQANVYNDLQSFIRSADSHKVACFQMPFPYRADFVDQVNAVYDHSDRVIILCSELHGRTVDFIRNNDREKITYFICGALNFELAHSAVYQWLDWIITTRYFYHTVQPDMVNQIKWSAIKPRMFDILLGTRKAHRDTAYNFVKHNQLTNQVVMTYFNHGSLAHSFESNNTEEWIWPADYTDEKRSDLNWTVTVVPYHGYRMSVSQIVPIDIYNQTAYTLVAETNVENDWCFFTEKIVKPIIGRRLFIVLGNRYYLKRLRELGFRTFDGIINEDYDIDEFSGTRASMAMQQLKWLCDQPQAQILEQIRPIVEHNFNLLMSTDWYDKYFKQNFIQYFN